MLTKAKCAYCAGTGQFTRVHNWSDGPGGATGTCRRCEGTGDEPKVDDLLRKIDHQNGVYQTQRHALYMLMRKALNRGETDANLLQTGWYALSEADRKKLIKQTGKRYHTVMRTIVNARQ